MTAIRVGCSLAWHEYVAPGLFINCTEEGSGHGAPLDSESMKPKVSTDIKEIFGRTTQELYPLTVPHVRMSAALEHGLCSEALSEQRPHSTLHTPADELLCQGKRHHLQGVRIHRQSFQEPLGWRNMHQTARSSRHRYLKQLKALNHARILHKSSTSCPFRFGIIHGLFVSLVRSDALEAILLVPPATGQHSALQSLQDPRQARAGTIVTSTLQLKVAVARKVVSLAP